MRKKLIKILNLLLAVAIVFSTMCALPLTASAAESGTCGENLTWTLDDNGTLTISGTGEMENYDIFSSYNPWYNFGDKITAVKIGDCVTGIGDAAFHKCTSLTSITIPDSVTSIGYYAFMSCTSLTSITIPDSVTRIGPNAFDDCTSLKNITIPDSVTSIGFGVFQGCSSLTSITMPNRVTYIGFYAFNGCTSLTSITIPDGVTSIGFGVFQDCKSLTSITIPDSVRTIEYDAFNGCNSFTVKGHPDSFAQTYARENGIPFEALPYDDNDHNTVTSGTCGENLTWTLDDNGTLTISGTGEMWSDISFNSSDIPWHSYRDKITDIIINEGVTNIGWSAFERCTSLTRVTIPNSMLSIGWYAFAGCTSLTSITIPDSITNIGNCAFVGCEALTNITIPDSVTSIESGAFNNTAYYNEPSNWAGDVLYIGNHLIESKTSLSGTYSIRSGTKSIAESAFGDCSSLTSVTIPDGVTTIGDHAFYYCTSLSNITIPDSVTTIGNIAFDGCSSLTGVTIPNSVTSIGVYAFRDCTLLASITIPDSVTSIGQSAFEDCSSLKNIEVQTENTAYASINGVLFNKDKTALLCYPAGKAETNYTIPNSVKCIGNLAFEHCISLTNITIPDSVTSIGHSVFWVCTSLKSIIIPDSVTIIGDGAFSECSSLKSVTIPNSVTSIGDFSFSGCKKCTIYGNAGSYAQEYAKENNIPFVAGTAVGDIFFIDVVPDEWYVSAVQYALNNKLFFGVSDNEFAPDEAMNRAMLVTVLWRLEGKPTVSATNTFNDVPANEWYTNAVLWASENGVVYGTSETEFSPEDSITREQMAAILYRYAKKKGYDTTASTALDSFPDGQKASSYARDALSWACGSGLIFGSDGKLLPQDGATRAQVAAILMRYTQKVVQ